MNNLTTLLLAAGLQVLLLVDPASGQGFVDTTALAGLSVPGTQFQQFFDRGSCWGDFDQDGDQDLVVPGVAGAPNLYFRNEGNGTFTDQSASAGLGTGGVPRACITADVDNDGDLDLYLTHSEIPSQLFLNAGGGVFAEVGAAHGVAHTANSFAAAFADYDRDGWVDIYVGNHADIASQGIPNILYHNDGDGTFTDVTASAGVGNAGLAFTVLWLDYDEDGWPDILVGNDRGNHPNWPPNAAFRNLGDGTFIEVSTAINCQNAISSMGSDVADVFNDGGWDVFFTNEDWGHVFLEWDPVGGGYSENAALYGVQGFEEGWAAFFLDYDNDGWQDLYINHNSTGGLPGINDLWRNPGAVGGTWSDTAGQVGLDLTGLKYNLSTADYDDDGDRDILQMWMLSTAALLRNDVATASWLAIETVGTRSNRSGIGAVVEVTTGATTQRQVVKSGASFMGSSDMRCHFGLGAAQVVDRVAIRWPSGQRQTLDGVAVNQVLTVVEPVLSPVAAPQIGTQPALALQAQGDAGLPFVIALGLGGGPSLPLGDGRSVPIDLADPLTLLVLTPGNPILPVPAGFLGGTGQGQSSFNIPALPLLIGLSIFGTAITADSSYSAGVKTIIDPPVTITFQ